MNQEELITILKEISLFQGLEETKLKELASISRIKQYSKDNTIFYEGEQSHALIIVAEGTVRICKHNHKGDRINIGVFRPYQLVAEAVTLKQTLFPASAYCETDVRLVYVEINVFRKNFLEDPIVSYRIIESLLEKIRIIETNIEINVASTAKEKIISFYKKNQTLNLGLKNYEIASLLGISAETFSRNLKHLEKEKMLYKSESGYRIVTKHR